MVGRRAFDSQFQRSRSGYDANGDLETGKGDRRFGGFKDAVNYVVDREITADLKKQLRQGVRLREFESHRKSDEEVSGVIMPST
jgi:hypothetical protein